MKTEFQFGGVKRPIPDDFREVAPGKTQDELRRIYRSSYKVVSRWLDEAGIPHKKGSPHTPVPVGQYDLDGNLIAVFPSVVAAASAVFLSPSAIWLNLSGHTHTAGGYKWKRHPECSAAAASGNEPNTEDGALNADEI